MKSRQIILAASLILLISGNSYIDAKISAVEKLVYERKAPYAELKELMLLTNSLDRCDPRKMLVDACVNRFIDYEIEDIFSMMIAQEYDNQSIISKIIPMQNFITSALRLGAHPNHKKILDLLTVMMNDVGNFELHRKIQLAREEVWKAISSAFECEDVSALDDIMKHIDKSLAEFIKLIAPYQEVYQGQLDECWEDSEKLIAHLKLRSIITENT